MAERILNPSGNLYDSFMNIINSITIKYFYKAQQQETLETKLISDGYIDSINKVDTFYSYSDYSTSELELVGINDLNIISEVKKGNIDAIPAAYRDKLLIIRRQRNIDTYQETNNYYRMLNGLPDLDDTDFFYPSSIHVAEYGIDQNIPVHLIQDHYNKIESGKGDYLITVVESSGYIDKLYELNPDKKYLNYIGTNRIDLYTSRTAKNFQIIQIRKPEVRQAILDIFVRVYEQCREYFVKTIYISTYSKFIDYYDNFIAMSIMIMTLQQVSTKQISLGIKREYFDINAIRALYEAYNVPYNLNIDEDTQADITQNLNLLIQNKSTDKVIYNIANLLGFTNVNLYKYYLTKEHIMDIYDVPIFKYTEKFNTDTGEIETVPDYNSMYDLYFQKFKLNEKDFVNSFNNKANKVEYNEVVSQDPFWWEDQHVYERLWESEYNFVESKYLSLGISYSMTELMFENVIFLKMILQEELGLNNIRITLPKIIEETEIPLFDVIILLLCLTSTKHKLWGEIISVPTQVISVVDYINNTDRGDAHHDTFTFDFNYFFNPKEFEDKDKIDEMKNDLIDYMNTEDKSSTLINSLGFNFEYFSFSNKDREENIKNMKNILGEEDYEKFLTYVEKVSYVKNNSDVHERIRALNDMFSSIKGLYRLLNYYLTKASDYETYESLKRIYYSLFVSKEMSELFTITTEIINPDTGEHTTYKRTAWTYFEYLYHKNPKLYQSVFEFNLENEYNSYISSNPNSTISIYDFAAKIASGEIFINYGKIINEDSEESVKNEIVYAHINHVISRLEMSLDNLKFMYMMNDSSTPLETLLMQLIRFFKSYTVDILDLDILYICDFKPDNMIKLMDKIMYIKKDIEIDENILLSYSDSVHKLINTIETNSILKLTDKAMLNTDIELSDSCKFTDKVCKLWYSD